MSEIKIAAATIVKFLKQQLESESLNGESRESVEVGVQCIETAFELGPVELDRGVDLLQLLRLRAGPLAEADREEAESLKNEGNELMKAEEHREALAKYSRAIVIDPRNAVFFCNRAAAHFKLGSHDAAVADCKAALALQPDYGKAHGRLGIALTALERHEEARTAFLRASQLVPDNESYRQNLRLAEEQLASRNDRAGHLDLGGLLLQNPAVINMANEMLSDPNMQNLISGLMTSSGPGSERLGGAGGVPADGMSALLEAGQALAQQMQSANPELVERLRRQMRPPGGDGGGAGGVKGAPPPPSQ